MYSQKMLCKTKNKVPFLAASMGKEKFDALPMAENVTRDVEMPANPNIATKPQHQTSKCRIGLRTAATFMRYAAMVSLLQVT